MVKIFICEDEKVFALKAHDEIEKILIERGEQYGIDLFYSGKELIDSVIREKQSFDILFMDIRLKDGNGIETAKTLREIGEEFTLIFLSHMGGKVFESFKADPLRFVRKDRMKEELEEALLKAVEIKAYHNMAIAVKTKDMSTINVKLRDIMYFQSLDRRICLYQAKEKGCCELITGSVKQYEERYANVGFVRVGKSHVVNVRYIKAIGAKHIQMKDGTEISLGRDKAKIENIKNKYYEYMRGSAC